MKKLTIAIIAAIGMTAAIEATADNPCEELHELATSVMTARQNGAAMPELMRIAGDNPLVRAIVQDAYNAPRYSTNSVQQREIADFANTVYAQCIKHF